MVGTCGLGGCVVICDFCHNFVSDGSCEDGDCSVLDKKTSRCDGSDCELFDCFNNYRPDLTCGEV